MIQLYGVCIFLLISALIHFGSNFIASTYTTITDVQVITSELLKNYVYIAYFIDANNAISAGVLRGMRKSEWTAYTAVGFCIIAIPIEVILGFVCGKGINGIWTGFIIGLACSGIFLQYLLRIKFEWYGIVMETLESK